MLHPDIGQAGAGRELVGHQFRGHPGEHDLPTLGQRPEPSGPVHRGAVVVAVAELGFPGVQRDPGRQGQPLRPDLLLECLLKR